MKQTQRPSPVALLGRGARAWARRRARGPIRRLEWLVACYRSARTTFEVLRLLDRESRLLVQSPSSGRYRFVAHTGYIA